MATQLQNEIGSNREEELDLTQVDHIVHKRCPAGVCKPFFQYQVVDPFCRLCGLCVKTCPVGAIEGGPKKLAKIVGKKCIKCGICIDVCPFDAITHMDCQEAVGAK